MSTQTESVNQNNRASTTGITLLDGEYVLENENPSLSNWWKSLLVGGIFALSTLSSAVQGQFGAAIFGIIVSGAIFGYVYYSQKKAGTSLQINVLKRILA